MTATIYDLVSEQGSLNVLIGPPGARAWREGPAYETFINGKPVSEGGLTPHVGIDLKDATEILVTSLYNAIIRRANELSTDTVIFRLGTEDSALETKPSWFSLMEAKYYPASLACRTSVAFANLTQGAYK